MTATYPARQRGRGAVVTGGAQGIGLAIARRLLEEGARVVVADLDQEALDRALGELGPLGEVVGVRADVSRREDVTAAIVACREHFGALEVFASNAATADMLPLLEISEEAWRRMIDINLTGAFHCIQEAGREMRRGGGGSIVATASTNAFWVEANTAHYSASKAGLVALVKTAAIELGGEGIRVNAVAPGMVRTRLTRFLTDDPVEGPRYLERIPRGRYAEPADVAAAVAYLASDEADYVTGELLVVDGGVSVGVPIEATEEPLPGAER